MIIDFRRSVLLPFLQRFPWAERKFLEELFTPSVLNAMIANCGDAIQTVDISGVGLCYALANEADQTVLGVWRYHTVRIFALNTMGKTAVMSGFSPTPVADGEFTSDGYTWRVWADIGNVAPEALGFIQHPPRGFGPGVRDLILTTNSSRFPSLAAQINLKWPGGEKVVVLYSLKQNTDFTVRSSSAYGKPWRQYTREETDEYFAQRSALADPRFKENKVALIARTFNEIDWQLLAEAGYIPFMIAWEMGYLETLRRVGDNRDHRRLLDKKADVAKEVQKLIQYDMLTSVSKPGMDARLVPSWQGLLAYAGYLGVHMEDLLRFQPWPQRKVLSKNGVTEYTEYSQRWLSRLDEHQTLCKQFALSLAFGARTTGNALGWPTIDVATTIASRLVFQQHDVWDNRTIEWVVPDALIYASIHRASTSTSPQVKLISQTLYVEIDRATNPITRLDDRLDRYAKVWPHLKFFNPALVWVIDGTDNRELQILKKMRERGLEGWTVTLKRLMIPFDHPDLTLAPPVFGQLEYDAVGGMFPFRPVWRHTSQVEDDPFSQFLFFAPWNDSRVIKTLSSNIYKRPN